MSIISVETYIFTFFSVCLWINMIYLPCNSCMFIHQIWIERLNGFPFIALQETPVDCTLRECITAAIRERSQYYWLSLAVSYCERPPTYYTSKMTDELKLSTSMFFTLGENWIHALHVHDDVITCQNKDILTHRLIFF